MQLSCCPSCLSSHPPRSSIKFCHMGMKYYHESMKSWVTSNNNSTIVNGFQINSEVYKFRNSRRVNFDPSNGFQEAWRFNTTRLEQTNSYFKVSPESLIFARRKKRHRRSQNPLTEEGWLPLKRKSTWLFLDRVQVPATNKLTHIIWNINKIRMRCHHAFMLGLLSFSVLFLNFLRDLNLPRMWSVLPPPP